MNDGTQQTRPPMPPLEDLIPVRDLELMTTLELGAVTRLLRHAWRYEDPPCTLPADPSLLARLARLDDAAFAAVQGFVERLFELFEGRRVHAASADAFWRLCTQASRRSEAGRTAIQARWSKLDRVAPERPGPGGTGPGRGGGLPAPPIRLVYDSNTAGIRSVPGDGCADSQRSAVLKPSPESAPAPLRRAESNEFNPALKAQTDSSGRGTALTARAPSRQDVEEAQRRADVIRILMDAHFPWAEPHRRTIARDLAERIADHRHVTPMLAAYVVQRVDDIGKGKAKDGGAALNPVGMLINQTGTKLNRRPPVDVPLWFAKAWGDRMERRSQVNDAQKALDALRARPVAVTSSAIAGGS